MNGITYPCPTGCQARRGALSAYFSYAKHGGKRKAHAAAQAWLEAHPSAPPLKVSAKDAAPTRGSGKGIVYKETKHRGITHYAWAVAYRDTKGRARNRTFFIGSENTWASARERAAHRAAKDFRIAYEHWRIHGGAHPDDTNNHYWSAKEH